MGLRIPPRAQFSMKNEWTNERIKKEKNHTISSRLLLKKSVCQLISFQDRKTNDKTPRGPQLRSFQRLYRKNIKLVDNESKNRVPCRWSTWPPHADEYAFLSTSSQHGNLHVFYRRIWLTFWPFHTSANLFLLLIWMKDSASRISPGPEHSPSN